MNIHEKVDKEMEKYERTVVSNPAVVRWRRTLHYVREYRWDGERVSATEFLKRLRKRKGVIA